MGIKDKQRKQNPVAKELITNPKFKHKMEKAYKELIHQQNEEELANEIKEFLNGETEV